MTRRPTILLFGLALVPFAHADRLISIPTARKLLDGSVRLESLRDLDHFGLGTDYLATAFGQGFEAEARILRGFGRPKETLDLTYNVVAAIPGFSPGVAVGIQDIADQTRVGPRAFLCTTSRVEVPGRGNTPFDVTSGLFVGRDVRPFVGTSIPVYSFLRFLAEHDGTIGQFGFEATPTRGLRMRLIARDGQILGSLGFTRKF